MGKRGKHYSVGFRRHVKKRTEQRIVNALYYDDNLKILQDHIKESSADLIYLDPPFNSNRNYNFLFRDGSRDPLEF